MLTVRFVRHGESLANAGGVTSEQHAIPLTDLGRSQALAFAEALHTPPALFITSPYIRARDTAAPSAARHAHVPLQVWPVHEIGILATVRCRNTTSPQRLPMVEAHWAAADPLRCDGEGAECYADFVARVREALARLATLDLVHQSKRRRQPEFGKIDAKQKAGAREHERSECVSTQAEAMVFSHGQFMNGVLWEIEMGSLAVTADSMLAFRGFHTTAPIENIKGFTARWDGKAWTIANKEGART